MWYEFLLFPVGVFFKKRLCCVMQEFETDSSIEDLRTDKVMDMELKGSPTFYLYKRNMIIREVVMPADGGSDDDDPTYQVRCCHCPPTRRPWGPYHHTFDMTSHYISHFENKHPALPRSQADENEALKLLRRAHRRQLLRATRNRWSSAQPVSVQLQVRMRPLNEHKYRRLLAAFVFEIDPTFRVVESPAFNKLVKYCNELAPCVSRETAAADINRIYG